MVQFKMKHIWFFFYRVSPGSMMSVSIWCVYSILVWILMLGQSRGMMNQNRGNSKDDGTHNIKPFQFLGNLRPTIGKTILNGFEPGGPGPHRRVPNLLPVKPFPIIQGNPNNHGGHNSYAPPMNNYGPKFNGPPTVVVSNSYGPGPSDGQGHNGYGPNIESYGPINSYGHGQQGYNPHEGQHPKRKLIGFKTVFEKRKVAIISNKKVPVVRMKQVVEKVPVVRMVNRLVKL
jgi:hypothetical protein